VGGTLIAFTGPFAGLPLWAQTLFVVVFVIIIAVWFWTLALFVASRRALHVKPVSGSADELLWVFLVPALNEEVTIADSVDRLLAVEAKNRVVLVIEDGSTDGTGAVLVGIDHPELAVLQRVPPDAQVGKAAARGAGLGRRRRRRWPVARPAHRGPGSRPAPDRGGLALRAGDAREREPAGASRAAAAVPAADAVGFPGCDGCYTSCSASGRPV
jgi:hypothetical protein